MGKKLDDLKKRIKASRDGKRPGPKEVKRVRFACGHDHKITMFTSRDCPKCVGDRRKNKKETVVQKEHEKKLKQVFASKKGRLPHGSRYELWYDGVGEKWDGVLHLGGSLATVGSSSPYVFKLMEILDDMYRAAVATAEKKE